jgi:hypothetical protein
MIMQRALIGLVALLLAGCAGQSWVYNAELSPAYRPTEYGYGAGRRDLTTVIQGDPFQLGEQPFDAQFIELLNRNQPILQPTHFTTTPGPSARPIYRAVFLFNTKTVIPNQLCREPPDVPQVEMAAGTVRVTAAFCRWQGYLSTVTGEVAATGVDDPRFERMIGQMIFLLFPPVDPNREDREPWVFAGRQPPAPTVTPQVVALAGE